MHAITVVVSGHLNSAKVKLASPHPLNVPYIEYVNIFISSRVFYDNITTNRYGSIPGRVSFFG